MSHWVKKNCSSGKDVSSYSHKTREHESGTLTEWEIRQAASSSGNKNSCGGLSTCHGPPKPPPPPQCVKPAPIIPPCSLPPHDPIACNTRTPVPCGTGNKINANAMYVNASDRSSVKVYVNGQRVELDSDDEDNNCPLRACGKCKNAKFEAASASCSCRRMC